MDAIYEILGIPFGYVLRFIFEAVNNYGLALILFTLFARLLMIPTSIYQTKGTVKTQRLQPKNKRQVQGRPEKDTGGDTGSLSARGT